MTEKLPINGKDVWIVIEPHLTPRENQHVIPTEYFTATYYLQEPDGYTPGELFIDGIAPRLFESPVAALTFVRKKVERTV